MNMDVTAVGYQSILDTTKRDLKEMEHKGVNRGLKDETITSDGTGVTGTNETKLSTSAQKLLKNLRKQYGDYDFFVGNNTDDLQALAKGGSKEFSVIFSNAELERMAKDEKYAKEKLRSVETAVRMSRAINKKFGFESGFGEKGGASAQVTRIGMVFKDDGTTSFFAELEKSSAKQREYIEKAREEKRTGKKTGDDMKRYAESSADTKRTTVWADSMEDLVEKMTSVDWNAIKAQKVAESGGKYDFSI